MLRGLHYHLKQSDYWYVQHGEIQVGLADLRPESPTYRATLTVEMSAEHNFGLFISPGVAHGFLALTDSTLTYVVNQYYAKGADEYGVAWNDPDLQIAWETDAPQLSPRDETNPTLRQIPPDKMP